jgi:hypothetical protein
MGASLLDMKGQRFEEPAVRYVTRAAARRTVEIASGESGEWPIG